MTVLSYEQSQGETFARARTVPGHAARQPNPRRPEDGARRKSLALLRQLASVLDYAHAHGSLHGSLHPSSILLNDRSKSRCSISAPPAAAGRNASPEQLLRAVHYLSPECIRDQPMDGRSDQFSLAVLAHRMLTGELPFSGKPLGVMFRIAYQGLERDAIRELPASRANRIPARPLETCRRSATPPAAEMVESWQTPSSAPARPPPAWPDAAEFAAAASAP